MPTFNGLVATYRGNEGPFDTILPLSSSFALIVHTEFGSANELSVCGRD
jgi:hypothetical protein